MNLKVLLLVSSLFLPACSVLPKQDPIIKIVPSNIPIQPSPEPVTMRRVRFDVVSDENLDQFLKENAARNSDLAFMAVDPVVYENLAINLAELKRYILAQKAIIQYYESQLEKEND